MLQNLHLELRELLTGKGFERIPLKRLASGHYTCEVKLNNVTGLFILDTGASTSCVGWEHTLFFNLKSENSEVLAAGAGATNLETKIALNNSLLIGNLSKHNVDLILLDLSHVNDALLKVSTNTIHGILGADFLKKHRAIIDYGRNCLYLL